jgi:hypothetical protein
MSALRDNDGSDGNCPNQSLLTATGGCELLAGCRAQYFRQGRSQILALDNVFSRLHRPWDLSLGRSSESPALYVPNRGLPQSRSRRRPRPVKLQQVVQIAQFLCRDMRRVFETVLQRCIAEGLVGGEAFAIDASLIKADANRQKGIEGEKGLPHARSIASIFIPHASWGTAPTAQLRCSDGSFTSMASNHM